MTEDWRDFWYDAYEAKRERDLRAGGTRARRENRAAVREGRTTVSVKRKETK